MNKGKQRKVAIVTGSTKGIGRGVAEGLCKAGFAVVLTSRDAARANAAAADLAEHGGETMGLRFELAERDQLQGLVQAAVERYGRLDVLVNNALTLECTVPFSTSSDEQVAAALTANVAHTMLLCRAAHAHLKENRGAIINIGSAIVDRHLLGLPLYAVIKAAISQMTRVLAAEWAGDRIRVNGIKPGFIRSSAFAELGMPDELVQKAYTFYKSYQPLGNVGEPADVAALAVYLASDQASYVTGAEFSVDGGYAVQGVDLFQG
jgi:NAD(P)-dependent dehydrogenase (short-subunit alcohol dehydrogenase family)